MKNRKEEIILATLELAAAKGLGAVSMQMIADKVGITKASLYNHFSSRDEIVKAMYSFLREASKAKANVGAVDFDKMMESWSLKKILMGAVMSYRKMVEDPQMYLFYTVIMSERTINSAAAEIMVQETQTMINATKAIFYALQVKGIADFPDVDAAALSFTMAVHAIIDHENDLRSMKKKVNENMLQAYIDEFCRMYEAKK